MQRVALRIFAVILALSLACACNRRPNPDEPVRLKFWHAWGGYEGQALLNLVDEYNRTHPGIIVEPSQFTIGDKLLASIAGGKPPDIATVWNYMLTPMGEAGAFLPLDDMMTSSGYTRDDFLPNVWEFGSYGPHRWGVPTTLNVTGIYYINRDVREAGLNPAAPPSTIAELESWSEKLLRKNPDGTIARLGFVPMQTDVWLQVFGGQIFDSSARQFTLEDPANVRALEWIKKLIDQAGGMTTYRRFSAGFGKLDSPANPMFNGRLAMKEDGQWLIQFFRNFAPGLEYSICPYPAAGPGAEPFAKLDGSFWAIPKGTKHPEEAWDFLAWLIAPEQNARLCAAWLNVPPMRATLDQPVFAKERQDPKFEFFVRMLAEGHAVPPPATPVSEQLYDALETGTHGVFSGSMSAQTMLKETNDDLNGQLRRLESLNGPGEDAP